MSDTILGEARPTTTRRKARVIALQVLYETDRARHEPGRTLDRILAGEPVSASFEAFARRLVKGVLENQENIDKIISTYAPTWPVSQLAIVDRNILRVAIFEIRLGGETPSKVAINEAVELAKIFGSDSSSKFVNGVLGSVVGNPEPQPDS